MSGVGATPTYGPGGRCFCVVCADEAARRVLERRPPRSPGHTPFRTKPSPSNPRELFEYVDHTSPKYTPLSPKFTPMSVIPSSIHQPSPSSRLATGSPIREDREARVHFAPMMPTRIRPPVDETGGGAPSPGHTMSLLHLDSRGREEPLLQLESSVLFKPPDDTEVLLREWNRKREESTAEALRTHVKFLEESLEQLHGDAQQKLAHINKVAQRDAARQAVLQERARQEQDRKTLHALQSLRQGHDQQHLEAESKLRSLKEKRDALERARIQEEMLKKAQEEERRRKEAEAEAQRLALQRKKEEEDAARAREAAIAAAAAAAAKPAAAPGGGAPDLSTLEKASARRQQRFEQADTMLKELAEMQTQIKTLPPDVMRMRPDMDRKIILNLNQVVATQEKCQAVIASILGVLGDASRANPILFLHCINTIATRLVQKGQSVAAQPTSAFPYAFVAVGLCQKCPQLTKFLRASFYKICPFTIPRYVRRQEGWTDAQFLEAQGYEPNEGAPNGFEPEDEYRLRMGGTVMLWAATLQTQEVFRVAHPFGIGEAWVWIATIGNMKPRRLTALMLHEFLKTTGLTLSEVYPQQFKKYMMYIYQDFINRLPAQTSPSDKSRLTQLAEAYLSRAADWSGVGRRLDPN